MTSLKFGSSEKQGAVYIALVVFPAVVFNAFCHGG